MDFDESFTLRLQEFGLSPASKVRDTPRTLVDKWDGFASECEASFGGSLDEYYGRLGVRSVLSGLLKHRQMIAFREVIDIAGDVARIDALFAQCLDFDQNPRIDRSSIDDGTAWYWNHFPKYCGPELASELFENYGIRVEVRTRS
ncbi:MULTISPECIES: hypothetical protein [unclassified Amycolatopsis]|uniref:hypothetical protein n=1 Tax=unclassified Amycolatopsis TaxID=2618356 RepID=UPI001C6A27CC|nr:hypothetical protein [Amycolatopsis sp. DSM 110486]QYN18812.1 hypothetical protein K1T34_39835 [Amycolatopsis sp. DSM 110486]